MRLVAAIAGSLCLLGRLVQAGEHSRASETLHLYWAYRLDVEVSSAEFPDEETPWKLGSKETSPNDPADWPNGQLDTSRRGMNFHAFLRANAKGYSGQNRARSRIADPWNPTLLEVKGIASWPRDDGIPLDPNSSGNRFSFNGIAIPTLLGVLNDDPKKRDNTYFQWDNILAIVAQRTSQLYEMNDEIGQEYYDKMHAAMRESRISRRLDSGPYKKQKVGQLLQVWLNLQPAQYKPELNKVSKGLKGPFLKEFDPQPRVRPDESAMFVNAPYQDMDWAATKDAVRKTVGPKSIGSDFYTALFGFFDEMAIDMVSCPVTPYSTLTASR